MRSFRVCGRPPLNTLQLAGLFVLNLPSSQAIRWYLLWANSTAKARLSAASNDRHITKEPRVVVNGTENLKAIDQRRLQSERRPSLIDFLRVERSFTNVSCANLLNTTRECQFLCRVTPTWDRSNNLPSLSLRHRLDHHDRPRRVEERVIAQFSECNRQTTLPWSILQLQLNIKIKISFSKYLEGESVKGYKHKAKQFHSSNKWIFLFHSGQC